MRFSMNSTDWNGTVECGQDWTRTEDEVLLRCNFIVGVLSSTFSCVGVLGNLFSVLVLLRTKSRECFDRLLIGLACVDTTFILCGGITISLEAFGYTSTAYILLFPFFLYPLSGVGFTGQNKKPNFI